MGGLARSLHESLDLTPTLYLAGPDVFHPDARELGARKKALCKAYGFVGLFPLDDGPAVTDSASIFANCTAMMQEATGGLFNLTPFRGPSADAGTVFELGYMTALGKPVFAYTNAVGDLLQRIPDAARHATSWRDATGMMIEDFGLADNLMIEEAVAAQGRLVHRHAAQEAARFTDMTSFEASLSEARNVFDRKLAVR